MEICGRVSGRRVRAEGLELASTCLHPPKDAVFEVKNVEQGPRGCGRTAMDLEDLNPLSGQRGPVAEPLPVAAPLTFGVVLRDGAVVRETLLSSAILSLIPCGGCRSDGQAVLDHPALHCVPRLRVEGPARGWISQRLQGEPPRDLEVVELVGVSEPRTTPPPPPAPPAPPRRPPRPALTVPRSTSRWAATSLVVCLTDAECHLRPRRDGPHRVLFALCAGPAS